MSGLATIAPAPIAPKTIDAQSLIAQAIERGTDPVALERLVSLGERMLAIQARQAWTSAMTTAQQEFPAITKTKEGQIGGGTYNYAPLDEIDAKIKPVLHKHGLVMTWAYDSSRPGEVGASCRLLHTLGHVEESGYFYVPIEPRVAGPDGKVKGATPAQRAGIAATYARRYSCCAITGIVPQGDDTDGGGGGGDDDAPPVKRADGSVLVLEVQEQSGNKKGGGTWTRWQITFDDGRAGSTFDRTLADMAKQAHADGALVVPLIEQEGRFTTLRGLSEPENLTGPVGEALDAFAADLNEAEERDALYTEIQRLGAKAKLTGPDKAQSWATYVGADVKPVDAPIEALSDLKKYLLTRAGE